ncbi:MAG: hydrogen gas-evolving membrane-bound hydrogenase subunit E [candidate division WOR-3 bacterium]
MIELYVLLVAMLAAAVVAIQVRDLLAAAVAMGLVGFSVAVIFILVQAPDLAIVQIVVEILSVVFFAAVILRTTHEDTTVGKAFGADMIVPAAIFGVFAVVFAGLLSVVLRELPVFGSPLMSVASAYIDAGLKQTGAANVVAAIILDYRAYDTLGEAVVLFTAVVGVLTVVRRFGRRDHTEDEVD